MITATTSDRTPRPTGEPIRSSGPAQAGRLITTELRLFFRQPQTLIFVFGFPVLTVLILGNVFGSDNNDGGFEFINPQSFYTAAYFGVVMCAVATIMLPVHVASYRESGILRRFDTSGFPRWAYPLSLVVNGTIFAVLGYLALLATAWAAFDIPEIADPTAMMLGLVVSTLAFVNAGVAIGMLLPSARAAQGVGLMLFFPMFLLGGGGPPPESLDGAMRTISDWMPLAHAIRAVQEPWLDLGDGRNHLVVMAGLLVASVALWVYRSAAVGRRN